MKKIILKVVDFLRELFIGALDLHHRYVPQPWTANTICCFWQAYLCLP